MTDSRLILAIETSCDETAAAVVDEHYMVRSSVVASQIALHAKWGGVVPEIANRQHVVDITGVIRSAMADAAVRPEDLTAVAVTMGPGLPGSLAVGIAAAKALCLGWGKPLVGVNHLAGHVFSAELNGEKIDFPAVYLLVSGGHCMILYAPERGRCQVLGSTRDDSVGEAYDKVARELGFSYPGGPALDKLAPAGRDTYKLPRPMMDAEYDFSFSGLKSAVRRVIDAGDIDKQNLITSFVTACMEVLTTKLKRAVDTYQPRSAVIVGGVSKSPILRERLNSGTFRGCKVVFPGLKYSTDNAAMIGAAGWWQYEQFGPASMDLTMQPRLRFADNR